MITMGQTKSDNINRMITITGDFYLVILSKWDFQIVITLIEPLKIRLADMKAQLRTFNIK